MSTSTGNGADPARAGDAGPASPRRERMLSELAAEIRAARADERRDVTQLQAELGRIAGLLGENADLLAQTLPRVTALDAALADVAARVNDLTTATPRAGVDWPALSAPDAANEWEALATWVADVLGPFYQLTRAQLPDCWALHPPAVIELIWLRRAYIAAHAPDAAPAAAGEWHTRWRRDALTNIAAAIPKTWCRPGEHYLHEHDRDRRYRDHPDPDQPPRPPAPDQDQPTPGRRPGPADLRIGLVGEITSPRHWGPAYQLAVAADLDWRRARDAAGGAPAPGG